METNESMYIQDLSPQAWKKAIVNTYNAIFDEIKSDEEILNENWEETEVLSVKLGVRYDDNGHIITRDDEE